MSLRTRTVAPGALTPEDEARWAELVDRALEPNPFLSPAYLATAVRHLPEARDVRLVVVEDDERMRALLPLSRDRSASGTAFATTAGPFLAGDSPLCVPLVDGEGADATLDALLRHLRSRANGFPGLVELTLLPGDGPLWDALSRACARHHVALVERYRMQRAVVRRAHGAPRPREAMSAARRKQLDRMQRRLEREVGPVDVSDDGPDPEAFEDFVRLEAAGWKGTTDDGGALAVSPGREDWFRDVASALRDRGNLRVVRVTAGGKTVYLSVLLGAGSAWYGLMDTYAEEFARCSPGTLGRVLEQEYLLDETDATLFDPCVHPSKELVSGLYRERRPVVGVVLGTRVGARALLALGRTLRRIHALRAVRALLARRPGRPDAPEEPTGSTGPAGGEVHDGTDHQERTSP